MSKYPRKRNVFDPSSKNPYKVSCSQIKLFLECPRCFYLDRRLGLGRPPGFPFTLNMAVDTLLKKGFGCYRDQALPHPLMVDALGLGIIPAFHEKLEDWQNNWKGVQYLHELTNLLITGAIDDLWWSEHGGDNPFHVVEYKATSRKEPVTSINPAYGYKEQVEIYQWLLRKNTLPVNDTAYFVYANGDKNQPGLWVTNFGAQLHFEMTLIQLECNDGWVEKAITDIHSCLVGEGIPAPKDNCDYCDYREAVKKHAEITSTESLVIKAA